MGSRGTSVEDGAFLLCCFKHGKVEKVDYEAVAAELGFKNPRSVCNKLSIMKKAYGQAGPSSGSSATKARVKKTNLRGKGGTGRRGARGNDKSKDINSEPVDSSNNVAMEDRSTGEGDGVEHIESDGGYSDEDTTT